MANYYKRGIEHTKNVNKKKFLYTNQYELLGVMKFCFVEFLHLC
jgi:hypothetical protein